MYFIGMLGVPPVTEHNADSPFEVCEGLDNRCCIESICDDSFDGVLGCVLGTLGNTIIEPW